MISLKFNTFLRTQDYLAYEPHRFVQVTGSKLKSNTKIRPVSLGKINK